MNEIREYQITQYSNSLIKGLKWVILVIFFSQVFQFVSIGVFDISQDSLFIQPRWTFNIQYAIRHILFGSGMPLTIYLIVLLLNKKFQKYNCWIVALFISYLATHYSFTHWGFTFLSNFHVFPVLLSCPYEKKLKRSIILIGFLSSIAYCLYQMSAGFSYYHLFILTINCSELILSYVICSSIAKVFNNLFIDNIALNKDAYIDKLTNLFNKNAFLAQKDKLTGKSTAFIDIDNFKLINDTQGGHEMGDNILRAVAAELKNIDNSTTYRFGGDEFVLFSHNNGRVLKEQLEVSTKRIYNSCLDNYNIPVTFSIGITSFTSGNSLDEVLHKADDLLYKVKDAGKNNILLDTSLIK